MARTDKDMPFWVRSLDDPNSTTDHHPACLDNPECRWPIPASALRDCTMGQRPEHPLDCQRRTYHPGPEYAPRALIRATWTRPERAAVRTTLRATLRDWNAHGNTDLDTEIPISQHRHAMWGGGWVD